MIPLLAQILTIFLTPTFAGTFNPHEAANCLEIDRAYKDVGTKFQELKRIPQEAQHPYAVCMEPLLDSKEMDISEGDEVVLTVYDGSGKDYHRLIETIRAKVDQRQFSKFFGITAYHLEGRGATLRFGGLFVEGSPLRFRSGSLTTWNAPKMTQFNIRDYFWVEPEHVMPEPCKYHCHQF